jgi:hypothetical protein
MDMDGNNVQSIADDESKTVVSANIWNILIKRYDVGLSLGIGIGIELVSVQNIRFGLDLN